MISPSTVSPVALTLTQSAVRVKASPVATGERRSEDVQATPDGVDVGSDLNNKREGQNLFFDCDYDVIRYPRIRVFNGNFDVVLEPGIDATLEGWELRYDPVNTGLSVQEIEAHEQTRSDKGSHSTSLISAV